MPRRVRGSCQGRALGWQSATGFSGPWYFEPEELGWLRGFGGGLVTTCGMEHALFMAEDTAEQYHFPAKTTGRYGLHGRVSGRPAKLTVYGERWDGDNCTLWAEGEVLQASQFGEHLLLRRRIEAKVGESSFTIHDEVENVGWDPTPHMYLYHINIGFPVVDAGSEILVPTRSISPRGDYPGLLALVARTRPHQVTLVPDGDGQLRHLRRPAGARPRLCRGQRGGDGRQLRDDRHGRVDRGAG